MLGLLAGTELDLASTVTLILSLAFALTTFEAAVPFSPLMTLNAVTMFLIVSLTTLFLTFTWIAFLTVLLNPLDA